MSYASEIEQRAIFNNWNSYSRGVGRLRIQGISEERAGSEYHGNRIGTEICWGSESGHGSQYMNGENNGANWILRVYADGTGYFYPDKLGTFNYATRHAIREMVYKHYRIIKEEYHTETGRLRFQVLRRKPLGQLSRKYFIASIAFGDHLKNKYNDLQESAT